MIRTDQLPALLQHAGMNITQLAAALGTTSPNVSALMKRKSEWLTVEMSAKVLKAVSENATYTSEAYLRAWGDAESYIVCTVDDVRSIVCKYEGPVTTTPE